MHDTDDVIVEDLDDRKRLETTIEKCDDLESTATVPPHLPHLPQTISKEITVGKKPKDCMPC